MDKIIKFVLYFGNIVRVLAHLYEWAQDHMITLLMEFRECPSIDVFTGITLPDLQYPLIPNWSFSVKSGTWIGFNYIPALDFRSLRSLKSNKQTQVDPFLLRSGPWCRLVWSPPFPLSEILGHTRNSNFWLVYLWPFIL